MESRQTIAKCIGMNNMLKLRLANITNDKICYEFVRNLCILHLNEPISPNGPFNTFTNSQDLYAKLVPKLALNGVLSDYQENVNTTIFTSLTDIAGAVNTINSILIGDTRSNTLNILNLIKAENDRRVLNYQILSQTETLTNMYKTDIIIILSKIQTNPNLPPDDLKKLGFFTEGLNTLSALYSKYTQPLFIDSEVVQAATNIVSLYTEINRVSENLKKTSDPVAANTLFYKTIPEAFSASISFNSKYINLYISPIINDVSRSLVQIDGINSDILTNISNNLRSEYNYFSGKLSKSSIATYSWVKFRTDITNFVDSLSVLPKISTNPISTDPFSYDKFLRDFNTSKNNIYDDLSNQIYLLKTKYNNFGNSVIQSGPVLSFDGADKLTDYKMNLYNAIILNLTSYKYYDSTTESLTDRLFDPTSKVSEILKVYNVDKPCFGVVVFGNKIDYYDPTIEKMKLNVLNTNDIILFENSLKDLFEKLKQTAQKTNNSLVLPNGYIGTIETLNYGKMFGDNVTKFGTFALVNPFMANANNTIQNKTINLTSTFGMIYMVYNPNGETIPKY